MGSRFLCPHPMASAHVWSLRPASLARRVQHLRSQDLHQIISTQMHHPACRHLLRPQRRALSRSLHAHLRLMVSSCLHRPASLPIRAVRQDQCQYHQPRHKSHMQLRPTSLAIRHGYMAVPHRTSVACQVSQRHPQRLHHHRLRRTAVLLLHKSRVRLRWVARQHPLQLQESSARLMQSTLWERRNVELRPL